MPRPKVPLATHDAVLARDRQIASVVRSGASKRDAARMFGVSLGTVYRALERWNGKGFSNPDAAPTCVTSDAKGGKEPFVVSIDEAAKKADRHRRIGDKTAAVAALHRPLPSPATTEREYTDEERTFLRACQDYASRYHKRFLDACEYLYVIKQMGYRLT